MKRALAAVVLLLAIAVVVVVPPVPARATESFAFTRIAGNDRVATAAQLALSTFESEQPTTALLARADDYPDALAGNYWAGRADGPVLLTARDELSAPTREALVRLGVETVVLLGGTTALSPAVEDAVTDLGLLVHRIAGGDRYETAGSLVQQLGVSAVGTNEDGRRTAVLASGRNFPDALAAGPLVYRAHLPLLLVDFDRLTPPTRQALIDLDIEHVIVAGGTAAVGDGAVAELGEIGITSIERIAGPTRVQTGLALATTAIRAFGFGTAHVNLATADGFADALAGGAHAAREGAPIVLVNSDRYYSSQDGITEEWLAVCDGLQAISATLATGHVLGGTAAVGDDQVARYAECARPTPSLRQRGQVVRVDPGADEYVFVDRADQSVRWVRYDDSDVFRIDAKDVSYDEFERRLAPGVNVLHADDTTDAGRDVHSLRTDLVVFGLSGNVDTAALRFDVLSAVTGDVVRTYDLTQAGPGDRFFPWGGVETTAAGFVLALGEGQAIGIDRDDQEQQFIVLGPPYTGTVTQRTVPASGFAAFELDDRYGDDPLGPQDDRFVARSLLPAGFAQTFAVDGLEGRTYADFAAQLTVGDQVRYQRTLVDGVSTEHFALTNLASPPIHGVVSPFVTVSEDPAADDPSGDRLLIVSESRARPVPDYLVVDYSTMPADTFSVDGVVVDEATFEAALSAGDVVVFQPGSNVPPVVETVALLNQEPIGQLGAVDVANHRYTVVVPAVPGPPPLPIAVVDYATGGDRYFVDGVERTLAQWEAEIVSLPRPAVVEVVAEGATREHRVRTDAA